MSSKYIHIPWGSFFPPIVPWVATVVCAFGAYCVYSGLWFVGGFITVFSFLAMALREGIIIDPGQKRLRSYWSLLGLQFGDWKPIDKHQYLVVLQSEANFSEDDFTVMAMFKDKVIHYDLYLMSANHLSRIMLSTFKEQKEALEAARDMSDELGLEFVKYNPGQTVHQKRY